MRILLVEDNPKISRFLFRVLSEEGHTVDLVGDGASAIGHGCENDYDLVLLDWMLPRVDGPDVCRTLRASGSRVPILMLTARADDREREDALAAGADDCLPKPFELDALLVRIEHLRRARRGASTRSTRSSSP